MTTAKTIGEIDLLTEADLTELARHGGGAHVSLCMPTHRAGPDTRQDPIRFKNLVTRAATLLTDQHGLSDREADALLAPARDLGADGEFWQYQADGLAVFLAPGTVRTVRVPLALGEEVTVGPRFRLRPLLPLLAGDGHFLLLALSQNEVRLYEGTRFTIAELDPGPIPGSIAEALAHEDPESQLQLRTGGEAGMYHGHGEGDEIDKQRLERYLRAVDRGLVERVGAGRRTPLVLAAVGYYLPMYAEVTSLPDLADRAVEGNPENRSSEELHAAAWDIVAPRFAAARREAIEAWHAAEATGTTSNEVAAIVLAALEGRIDTLFLAGDAPVWGRLDGDVSPSVEVHDAPQPGDDDLLDLAAAETILTGGTVYTAEPDVPDGPGDGSPAAARLRW
jgi:hypothetical protein